MILGSRREIWIVGGIAGAILGLGWWSGARVAGISGASSWVMGYGMSRATQRKVWQQITNEAMQKIIDEEKKRIQEEADKAKQETRAKSTFLANMSHELRTPLNAIIGYADIASEELKDGNPEPEAILNYYEKIKEAGKQLLNLINDILDLSKIEAGKMNINLDWVELEKIYQTLKTIIEPIKGETTIEIITPKIKIYTDEQKLTQILINLTNNAIKFTKNINRPGRVEIHNEIERENLVIHIRDNGIGMSQEALVRVFEPFTQAETTTSKKYGGTGLGLTIVANLVRLLQGKIEVSSQENIGTEFIITLPIKSSNNKIDNNKKEENMILREKKLKKRVLFLDEDEKTLELIKRNMKDQEFEGCECQFLQEYNWEEIEKFDPEIIFLELIWDGDPKGIEMITEIRKRKKKTPIWVISSIEERKAANEAGGNGYILKPLTRENFRREIKRALVESSSKGKILIIEDTEAMRSMTARGIERKGYTTLQARNGSEALNILKTEHVNLIILDLMMPETSGYEFLDKTRNTTIPIIIYTAKDLSLQEKNILQQNNKNIKGFLAKSGEIGKLIQEVEKNLRTN